ncbi:hypothetical protein ABW45_04535 [Stenotrophomonas maltophilia]|nr:hypothetical protein ABW45_04535 [Stenotrophomonas maltophilia]
MSEIKRWSQCPSDEQIHEDPEGNYVLHSDYEAEVSRLRAEVEAYRKDAERWRYARRILPVLYIEDSQEKHVLWARVADESENVKADTAIDAAMGASA